MSPSSNFRKSFSSRHGTRGDYSPRRAGHRKLRILVLQRWGSLMMRVDKAKICMACTRLFSAITCPAAAFDQQRQTRFKVQRLSAGSTRLGNAQAAVN